MVEAGSGRRGYFAGSEAPAMAEIELVESERRGDRPCPISVERVIIGIRSEGPGSRAAVWVRGCSIRCPGCINPHLFEIGSATHAVEDLALEIISAEVEGVTLLGGEPFDQSAACGALAMSMKRSGLGVITFTGYSNDELHERGLNESDLYQSTDLLIDGPYERSLPERHRSLVGSTNQNFIHLTDRYRQFDEVGQGNFREIRISLDGSVVAAGFWRTTEAKEFRRTFTGRTGG